MKGCYQRREIAGFLAKVDEATNTVPVARPQAVQARSRDLGVQGISIGANAEQPNRAGVLIAAVKSGSVGQKSRLDQRGHRVRVRWSPGQNAG